MKYMKRLLAAIGILAVLIGCIAATSKTTTDKIVDVAGKPAKIKLHTTDAEWKTKLTENQFNILRKSDTETPFQNAYWDNHVAGTYVCAACGQKLFSSDTKFESGTGWPSFWTPIDKGAILYRSDSSIGMDRTEVICSNCGGHLGHVFDDGPKPTGLRFCMNSGAMKFVPKAAKH
jgi:peptide-methionine (R)-S-oxide reductase